MNFFLKIFFGIILFLGLPFFLYATGGEQYSLMSADCKQLLIGPVSTLSAFKQSEIKQLSGENFCFKVSTEVDGNERTYFIALTKDWLLKNQIANVNSKGSVEGDGAAASDRSEELVFVSGDQTPELLMQAQPWLDNSAYGRAKDFFQNNPAAAATAGTIATIFSLTTIFNFLQTVRGLDQIRGIFVNLIGLFFVSRRKRATGVVYDGVSGRPISLATVSIIDESGKVRETKTTDRSGGYFFMATPGDYQLKAFKKDFRMTSEEESGRLSAKYQPFYFNNKTVHLEEGASMIKEAVPLVKDEQHVSWGRKFSLLMERVFSSRLWDILFWLGLVFSLGMVVFDFTAWHLAVSLIYVLSYLSQKANFKKVSWGTVFDQSGAPAAFAIVKAFDESGEKILARVIANEKGRYALILDEGKYLLAGNDSQGGGGGAAKTKVSLSKRKFVTEDIFLG